MACSWSPFKVCPQTPVLLGIRHALEWFKRFSNFWARNYKSMPGRCLKGIDGLCTSQAQFHGSLAGTRISPNDTEKSCSELKRRLPWFDNKLFLFTADLFAKWTRQEKISFIQIYIIYQSYTGNASCHSNKARPKGTMLFSEHAKGQICEHSSPCHSVTAKMVHFKS
jgi:hypothetical protein